MKDYKVNNFDLTLKLQINFGMSWWSQWLILNKMHYFTYHLAEQIIVRNLSFQTTIQNIIWMELLDPGYTLS